MEFAGISEQVKSLHYQCRFHDAIATIDRGFHPETMWQSRDAFSLFLVKSQALFELHRVDEATQILRFLSAKSDQEIVDILYVQAKLAYLEAANHKAVELFQELLDRSETARDYFKALLGLVNTWHAMDMRDPVEKVLPDLLELAPVVAPDLRLSFELFYANYLFETRGQRDKAEKLLYGVIRDGSRLGWNYFIVKSLFILAKICQACAEEETRGTHLNLLRAYIDADECVYLTRLVEETFTAEPAKPVTACEFDYEFKRVKFQGEWISLHDKPMIYRFLERLNSGEQFVGKKELAAHLWPNQVYKPRTHDARIFDIVRRVRSLIESGKDESITLMSGRFGYRLAIMPGKTTEPAAPVGPSRTTEKQRVEAGGRPLPQVGNLAMAAD